MSAFPVVLRMSMHYHSPLATHLGPVHDRNDHWRVRGPARGGCAWSRQASQSAS